MSIDYKHPLYHADLTVKLNYAAGLTLMMEELKVDSFDEICSLLGFGENEKALIKTVTSSNPDSILETLKKELSGQEDRFIFLFDVCFISQTASDENAAENLVAEVAKLLYINEDAASWIDGVSRCVFRKEIQYALDRFDRISIYDIVLTEDKLFHYVMERLNVNPNELRGEVKDLFLKEVRKWEKVNELKKYIKDPQILKDSEFIARTQAELESMKNEYNANKTIYLIGTEFTVTYGEFYNTDLFVGINKPTVYLAGNYSASIVSEDDTYVFDCDTNDFKGVFLTAKEHTEVYYSKDENRLQECEIDQRKLALYDPSEETADFLEDAIPKLKELGWLD